jgi:demethylspheroidene O-methyltransferase
LARAFLTTLIPARGFNFKTTLTRHSFDTEVDPKVCMVTSSVERNAIMALCRGFRSPALLFAAFDFDLFDHIHDEGRTAEELSVAVNAPAPNLRFLLNALVALKILSLRRGRYFLAPSLSPLLRRGSADYLGDFIRSAKRENEHWLHASEIISGTYEGSPFEGETLDAAIVGQTLTNVEISNRSSAESMWPHLKSLIPSLRRVIDVGGGHGYYSELLLRRAPQARVTIYDLPAVIEYCMERQASNPLLSRMEFVAGDALELDYEEEFDLVLMNDLLVYFDRDEKLDVLRRAHRALKVGGTLAVVKQRLENSGCSPARWALFSFRIFVTTGKGYLEQDSELVELTQEAGFVDVQSIALEDERTLLTGRRAAWQPRQRTGTKSVRPKK